MNYETTIATPSYLIGKEVHEVVPQNDADVPGVPKNQTTISYVKESDEERRHPYQKEFGSTGDKMHDDKNL